MPAAAQTQPGMDPGVELMTSIVGNAIGAALSTLILGGGLVLLAPDYTERTTDRIHDEPLETFLYGLGISIAAVVVMFLLAITIVGILLVIPMAIILAIVAELGYLSVGRSVSDEWGVVLLIAIVVATVVGGVPIIGALIGFVLSSMGVGAAYFDYKEDGDSGGDSSTTTTRPTGGRGGIDSGSETVPPTADPDSEDSGSDGWGNSGDSEWGVEDDDTAGSDEAETPWDSSEDGETGWNIDDEDERDR